MKAFLSRLAHNCYQHLGNNITNNCFVFPNRRAGLLFKHFLMQEITQPLLAPEIITIDQLFQNLSPLHIADPIDLQLRLYTIYTEHYLQTCNKEESFDDFLFWGKMIINDFSEIDRQMVNAQELLTTIADIKEIEQRFETTITDTNPAPSVRLSAQVFQRCLLPIYNDLRQQLYAEQLAYMGMLQRDLINRLQSGEYTIPSDKSYTFVGFNILTEVERQLMLYLQAQNNADFYFDYESFWLRDSNNRASLMADANKNTFPSRFPLPVEEQTPPVVHWIKCSTSVSEAEKISHIVNNYGTDSQLGDLGIVLPNEHMLLPLLYALPDSIGDVNITMGLPLSDTPLYTLLQHLSELQIFSIEQNNDLLFYYKPVMGILNHPYIVDMQPEQINAIKEQIYQNNMVYIPSALFQSSRVLSAILRPFPDTLSVLQALSHVLRLMADTDSNNLNEEENIFQTKQEYIYRTLLIVNRLLSLIEHYKTIAVQEKTIYRLLLQLMQTTTVPFEGEPLKGMQIMGVLEARGMDFKTVIIPDMNEDIYPGNGHQNSFIPYDLRQSYNLATPERQDAIASYNFYRLLSHAQTVYLLQTTSEDGHSPDASRYIYQLLYQYNHNLIEENYTPADNLKKQPLQPLSVHKDSLVLNQLIHRLCPSPTDNNSNGLSPSALNNYVHCPLQFYLQNICSFHEPAHIEESIQSDKFGNVFHHTIQHLYAPYASNNNSRTKITTDTIRRMLKQCHDNHLVEHFYAQEYLSTDDLSQLQGRDLLPVHVLQQYVDNVLKHDFELAQTDTFYYIASEQHIQALLPLSNGHTIRLHGIIDRVDEVNGQVRIIDYKTGASHCKFPAWDQLFSKQKNPTEADHTRQTLVYALCYSQTYHTDNIVPYIYYVRQKTSEIEQVTAQDPNNPQPYADLKDGFSHALTAVLEKILNPNEPFVAYPDKGSNSICSNCPFRSMCF